MTDPTSLYILSQVFGMTFDEPEDVPRETDLEPENEDE